MEAAACGGPASAAVEDGASGPRGNRGQGRMAAERGAMDAGTLRMVDFSAVPTALESRGVDYFKSKIFNTVSRFLCLWTRPRRGRPGALAHSPLDLPHACARRAAPPRMRPFPLISPKTIAAVAVPFSRCLALHRHDLGVSAAPAPRPSFSSSFPTTSSMASFSRPMMSREFRLNLNRP